MLVFSSISLNPKPFNQLDWQARNSRTSLSLSLSPRHCLHRCMPPCSALYIGSLCLWASTLLSYLHSPRLLVLVFVSDWHNFKAAEFFRGGARLVKSGDEGWATEVCTPPTSSMLSLLLVCCHVESATHPHCHNVPNFFPTIKDENPPETMNQDKLFLV